jgi:hypothetical protein
VITADIEWPPTVAQKSESSKVMNGVAVKPAEGIKNGHPVVANKDEDDDNDVIIMRSPDTISSSSEGVVVEGNARRAATDEAQRAGKSLFLESQLAENLRLETKANTVAVTEGSAKKQELEDSERKEDSLKKIEGINISGKELKSKEVKEEESHKKEHLKDEEMMRKSTESSKDSWKKEPEKIVERNSVPPSEQMEKETAKNKASLNTASDVTSQPAEMKDSKPADRTEDIICKDNEQVIKEITSNSEKSVKEERDNADNRKEVVCSNIEVRVEEQKCVSPEKVAEIGKKESVKAAEKGIGIKEGFKKEEAKTEYSSKLQENDSVKTGNLPSVHGEEIKKGSAQQKEESKDETLGESYKKLIEGTKKESPKKEEAKEIERRDEFEIKTLEKSTKEKDEETIKGWPKKEEGRDVKKVEDSSKAEVEEIKGFPKKENEIGNSSVASKRELLEGKAETLIAKEEQSLKDEAEDIQKKKKKKKEETEIAKKAELMKKEKASRKDTEGTPKEKKSEKTSSCGVENELPRAGGASPALSKPTRPKSTSSAVSESTTSRKTSRTSEPPTSGPKELTTTITPEPEVEKSPRTKTPKDLGESKPKRRSGKKRESQSLDEVAKKQGNDTAASITVMKHLLFSDISLCLSV